MAQFAYARPDDVETAIATVTADPDAVFLAGGTTLLDLMLKDAILAPAHVVDVTRLPLRGVYLRDGAITVGATTTMEELATDPIVGERLSLVREALLLGASTQLRNMATIGGNLLQRTRCRYFRDRAVAECNKRLPGSGCAAIRGPARMHAILGASDHCIALHASDLCVALVAVDAVVHTESAPGPRDIPLASFYKTPGDRPDVENVLEHGELITHVDIPLLPRGMVSTYLKVRDRASYDFALTSTAAALLVEGGTIVGARVAVGGVGTIPWRAYEAEKVLTGARATNETFHAAAEAAIRNPFVVAGTLFKVELAKRTIVRALQSLIERGS